jgi:chromate transporter
VRSVPMLGGELDVPVPGSIRLASLVLTLGAMIAVFRFKVGMLKVLAACSIAGLVYGLTMGGV